MIKYPKLNIEFPNCPFIWHYEDMANIYPVVENKESSYTELKDIIGKYDENKSLSNILLELKDNADFYIISQCKKEDIYYNSANTREIYISFHTWLYKYLTNKDVFDGKINVEFDINCGIYPVAGELDYVNNYPYRIAFNKKTQKHVKLSVGIAINNISERQCSIHESGGYTRFSPHNECNLLLNNDTNNFIFVSVIKNPSIPKASMELQRACVTLHIFKK